MKLICAMVKTTLASPYLRADAIKKTIPETKMPETAPVISIYLLNDARMGSFLIRA